MVISLNTLLLVGLVALLSGIAGIGAALLGVWLWFTAKLVYRMRDRGELYLADWDHARAAELRTARDMETGLRFLLQALGKISPEMLKEVIGKD